jgi:hypothetical protein
MNIGQSKQGGQRTKNEPETKAHHPKAYQEYMLSREDMKAEERGKIIAENEKLHVLRKVLYNPNEREIIEKLIKKNEI